jgi:hypothetical protein
MARQGWPQGLQRPGAAAGRARQPHRAPAGRPALDDRCRGTPAAAAATAGAKPAASVPKLTGKDKALEEKRKQAAAAEAEKKKAEDAKRSPKAAPTTASARPRGQGHFDSGVRIARVNDKGEREIMDDNQRAAEAKRLRPSSLPRLQARSVPGLRAPGRFLREQPRRPRSLRESARAAPPSGRPAAAGRPPPGRRRAAPGPIAARRPRCPRRGCRHVQVRTGAARPLACTASAHAWRQAGAPAAMLQHLRAPRASTPP